MTAINCVGDFFGITGYSAHTRGLVRALKQVNEQTTCETQMPVGWEKNVDDLSFSIVSKPADPAAWQVLITNPLVSQFKLLDNNKGVLPFMVFEGDKAPKQWVQLAKRFRRVLVPSQHTKSS